jgi:hypothetical protein
MRKSARRGACIGFGFAILVGCGSQAVEFPGTLGGGQSPISTSCTTASQCAGSNVGNGCVGGVCGPCSTDENCEQGQFCNGGVCGPCTSSSQCTNGKACVSGRCEGCLSSNQCDNGAACVLGKCGPCTSDSQCGGTGQTCFNGLCSCTKDEQCPADKECKNNVCITRSVPPDGGIIISPEGGDGDADAPTLNCNKPVYQITYPSTPSMWSLNGKVGTEAGNEMCKLIGADHFCDYAEINKAKDRGELNAVNGTFWVHRTTTANVGGVANSGGAGARCDDWRYATNHINNGEFVTITNGNLVYDLAPANMLTAGAAPAGASNRKCGGVSRSLLCCYAKTPGCP